MSLSYLACCNPDTNVRERNFATRGWYFGCVPVAAESSLDELPDSSEEVGTIDVAFRVRCDAFGHARPAGVWVRTRIGDEVLDGAVSCAPYANAPLNARIEAVAGLRQSELSGVGPAVSGFRVGDVDHIILVDIHTTRAAKLEPLSDKLPVLIENLDPVVLAITDKQPPLRVERNGVRHIELARSHAFSSPRLDELSIFIEFHDSGVARRSASSAVSISDEDVAVRSDRNFGRLVEFIEIRSGNTRLAQRRQETSVRAELQDLLPFAPGRAVVGNPYIAVSIHGDFMRADDHTPAKALQQPSSRVKSKNWVKRRIGTRSPARPRSAASINRPDGSSIRSRRNTGCGSPFPSIRQSSPVHAGSKRIRQIVARAEKGHRRQFDRILSRRKHGHAAGPLTLRTR